MTDQSTFDPGLPDSVRVLAGPGQGEMTEQRSRFLAFAFPAPDETAAREAIAGVARRYHDARHACSAWRLGHGLLPHEHRNDDGEPSGTAGEPLLAAIRKRELTDCVVVVVRYFGGVKLGTGGLARAYGGAAALALDAAPVADLPLGRRFRLRFPYPLRRVIEHLSMRVADAPRPRTTRWRSPGRSGCPIPGAVASPRRSSRRPPARSRPKRFRRPDPMLGNRGWNNRVGKNGDPGRLAKVPAFRSSSRHPVVLSARCPVSLTGTIGPSARPQTWRSSA